MKRKLAGVALVALVALPLMAAGAIALSVALWLALETFRGAVFAWAVVGLIYLAAGLFTAGGALLVGRRPSPPPRAEPEERDPLPATLASMAEAFAIGMQAGRNTRRGRRDDEDRRAR